MRTNKLAALHYTEFRRRIYALLDTYEMYCEIPDASPRVDLEDDIDNLLIELKELCNEAT